jgi:medium-chain acyl-[acyl-carrier-protein] hydrolase
MDPREDRFTVEAFDCRPDGGIKPNALMQYLQEAAARHAQQLGVGFADLDRQDCFWVLVNFRLEMTGTPHWGDIVTIRTWPSGFTRLIASREFIGMGADGREVFRAASEWMILDKHSSRPKNLQRLDLHLPPTGPKALSAGLVRLRPAEVYASAGTLSVPFSSLDFNGHVNNTEYVRWALDGLRHRFGRAPVTHSMQGTYLAEVFEGDQIEILVTADGAGPLGILERRAGGAAGDNVFLLELEEYEKGCEL